MSDGGDVRDPQTDPQDGGRLANNNQDNQHKHPFQDAALRIAGNFNRAYLFHGQDRQGEFSITQRDLFDYGYRVLYLRPCYAQLWWDGEKVQDIYCQRDRIREPDPRPEIEPDTYAVPNPLMKAKEEA